MVNGKEKLIVAIDTNEFDKAKELIDKLEDSVDINLKQGQSNMQLQGEKQLII